MRGIGAVIFAATVLVAIPVTPGRVHGQEPKEVPATPTKQFDVRNDRPFLGGEQIDIWGLRCGNALYSPAVTERHVNNLDNMVAHGINCIGVYIQGANAGWPDPDAGLDGFRRDGRLKPDVEKRLEWLIREADKRDMVVMVGILSPRKDQDLYDDAAIQRAIEESGRFLVRRKLRNVFVDIMHEFDQPERIDHALLREPDGPNKKAKLTKWFKAVAPRYRRGSALTSIQTRATATLAWMCELYKSRRRSPPTALSSMSRPCVRTFSSRMASSASRKSTISSRTASATSTRPTL